MKHSGCQIRFLVIVCVCYVTLANAEVRSKRFTQNSAIRKALTLDNEQLHREQQQQLHNNYINRGSPFVSGYDSLSPDTPSDSEDPDEVLADTILHPSPWYSTIHSSVRYPLTHFYMGRQDEEKGKRFFDSLGGSEVHGFKRSPLGRLGFYPERFYQNTDIVQMIPDPVSTYDDVLVDTNRPLDGMVSIEKTEDANQHPLLGSEVHYLKPLIHKRALDSLGGFQVHGWKKRAVDSVDKLHMSENKSTARQIIKSGEKLSDVAEKKVDKLKESVEVDQSKGTSTVVGKLVEQKHVDGSNFDVNDNDRDRYVNYHNFGKRALDSLGDFHVHGWKRDEGKRALDSLGDFQVHGWKRDEGKRALDSLGDFHVHGWKRDEGKRALDSLGDFQVHGWKRDARDI